MIRGTHRLRLVAALMVLLALLATACGDSDDGGDGSGGEAAPPENSESDGVVGPGVTADAIKAGVTIIDFEALKKFNVKINRGDEQLVWEALIEDLNARGGVLGRTIEPTYAKYDLIQAASGEAACLKLTEDSENFVVLGGFLAGAATANQCLLDHGAFVIGGDRKPEVPNTVPWISPETATSRQMELWADLLVETGQLEGKKFAVIGNDEDEASIKEDLLAPLAEEGFEPEDVFYSNAPAGDLQAGLAAYDVYTEKIKSAGVEVVLLAANQASGATQLLQRDYKGKIAAENADVISGIGQYAELPREAYNGVLSMVGIGNEAFDHPESQKCVKVFEKAHPEIGKLKKPINVKEGDEDWGTAVVNACDYLALMVKVLETAGTPSHEAIAEALDTKMENFSFGSVDFAGFGPGKYDANDGFRLAVFDSTIGETGGLKPKGKLVDVTG